MKRFYLIVFIFCISVFAFGCNVQQRKPLTVTFIDISGALSTDHTIKISFAEEKDYEDYYVDILVKADRNVELTLYQEFASESDKITLNAGNEYISLDEYKLFNMENEQLDSMVGYADALVTNLVINSSCDAVLTFLAVIGENDNGSFKQTYKVSNEFTINVLKH